MEINGLEIEEEEPIGLATIGDSGWGEGRVGDDMQVSFFPGHLDDRIVINGDEEHRERSGLGEKDR